MTKKLPIVEIEWLDTGGNTGWMSLEHYLKASVPGNCRSTGYLLRANRKEVAVLQSLSDDIDLVADSTVIPRSCVKSIKRQMEKPNGKA